MKFYRKAPQKRELQTKYELYRETGVMEYWLVYPYEQTVHQFVLENGLYQLKKMYTTDDIAVPFLFPDLAIEVNEIFS